MLRKLKACDKSDWASKIHLALFPAYHHNHLMYKMLASCLHVYMCRIALKSGNLQREADIGRIEIGSWLINSIFKFSRTLL
ncbi:hypothetical protein AAW31_16870 [Nitrosomonas communis]|uniref:Uncharacterized protein n=1 Tax=Nitrosomonas communis TaxID=44574 RepID=A0A0F7KHX1_9PROT|nr:hypothetical protein AAW31_16870 [Nitrosomonas communis]